VLCYDQISAVPPVIQWTLPEAVVAGSSVTGSCRATGYPRPSVDVMKNCGIKQYQHKIIDEYTSEVEFTIKSITKNCQHIYCYTSSTYEERKLPIAGKQTSIKIIIIICVRTSICVAENIPCISTNNTVAAAAVAMV